MGRLFIIFLAVFFAASVCARAEVAQQIPNTENTLLPTMQDWSKVNLPFSELDNISELIARGQSQADIMNYWKGVLTRYSGMDVNSAIRYVSEKAMQHWQEQNPLFGQSTPGQEDLTQQRIEALNGFIQCLSTTIREMSEASKGYSGLAK